MGIYVFCVIFVLGEKKKDPTGKEPTKRKNRPRPQSEDKKITTAVKGGKDKVKTRPKDVEPQTPVPCDTMVMEKDNTVDKKRTSFFVPRTVRNKEQCPYL